MIEADPVDPISALACIPVTHLNAPVRRVRIGDKIERSLHRRVLLAHAILLPLAVHANVECNGVIENGPGARYGPG